MTNRRKARTAFLTAVVVAAVALALGYSRLQAHPSSPPPWSPDVPKARYGGLDVTFLIAADTHFGAKLHVTGPSAIYRTKGTNWVTAEFVHKSVIAQMNQIEGTPYPPGIGGKVDEPLALLIAGDLTEDGRKHEWQSFVRHYGGTGHDGLLRYPVYEALGNHDLRDGPYVSNEVGRRHGHTNYAWDWGDLHVACLGVAPDEDVLEWLRDDLAEVGPHRPVILYMHYPLLGPWAEGNSFGKSQLRSRMRATIDGYNIVGIFHGHSHLSGLYEWNGYDVYAVGAFKGPSRSFEVVRVTDERMTVAAWNFERRAFWWWDSKPINGADEDEAPRVTHVANLPGPKPQIPHPLQDNIRY